MLVSTALSEVLDAVLESSEDTAPRRRGWSPATGKVAEKRVTGVRAARKSYSSEPRGPLGGTSRSTVSSTSPERSVTQTW